MSRAFITKINAFTPLAVPGCVLWLDGADSTTITGNVTSIREKANNVSLSVSGTVTATTIGSQSSLSFGGSGYLSGSVNSLLIGTSFIVFKATSTNSASNPYFPFFTWRDNLSQNNFPAFGYVPGGVIAPYTTYIGLGTPATAVTIGNTYLTSYSWSGTTTAVGFNGTTPTSGTQPAFTSTETLLWIAYDNQAQTLAANIGEILLYNTVLGTSQRQQVEGYLAQKWGLTASLPPGHPGLTQIFYTAGKNPGIAAVPSNIVTDVPYTNYFPLSIAGCTMWLDGADSSKVLLNGSTVSQWTDKSAAGNNATQPTAGNQPSYSASGIVFAGNQWLITPIDVNPTAESFFIVFKTTNNLAEIFSGTNVNGREVLVVSGVMYLSKYGTNPVGLTPNGGSVSTNTVTLFDYQYTTSLVTLNLNGLQTGSGAPPVTYSGTGTSYIGSSTYAPNNMYGTIYEIIYYNVSLTSNQRQSIEGYLAWKWGITLTNTHPYYTTPPLSFNRPTQVASIPLQLQIIPQPWTPLRPLSSGVLPWHWFRGDVGMTTTAWTNFGTSKSNASNVGTITLGNYTQGGSQAGGTNNTCTVSPSGYWNWPGVYQTSYHAIFGVFKLSASLTNGQTWTWKGNSFAGRGYTPQYRITNTSGVFTDDILSQNAFLPLSGVTIDPSTRFYTHSMVWGSTPAVSLLQVGTKIASPNGWTTDYGLGIYNNEYIGYAVAPAQPAGVTMTVCEILLFATDSGYGGPVDLTAQDILDVQSYLARKWGV
jgi:hypothetical protein